jgi:hypothetical protein
METKETDHDRLVDWARGLVDLTTEEAFALVAEVRKGRAVVKAWTDAGPQPHAHRQAQRRLLRDWPTLANALVAAAPPIVGG